MTNQVGRPSRVMVLIPSVEGTGGTERSLLLSLAAFEERGVAVDVVVFSSFTSRIDELIAEGATVTDLSSASSRLDLVRQVRRLLRERQIDVLHTMLYDGDVIGRLAAWGTGVAVLSSMVSAVAAPSDRPVGFKARLAWHLDAFTARHLCDHVHAVTPGVRQTALEWFRLRPERVTVVERGRDPQALGVRSAPRRAAAREALGLTDREEVVIAAGRHYPDKDHLALVAAVSMLQPQRPGLHLVLAGRPGPMTDALTAAAAQVPDPKRIHILGHREDVAELMAAADVFAQPSRREGAAGAVIEAAALSLPIVRSDVDGLRGQFRDEVEALVVPVGDVPALAAGIVRVLDDPDLAARLGAAARASFDASFQLDANAERLVDLVVAVGAHEVAGRWDSGLHAATLGEGADRDEAAAATARFYDDRATSYRHDVDGVSPAERHLFGRYVRSGDAVLDIGIGTGRTVVELRERAGSYSGIDLAPAMVAEARERHPGVQIEVGDAADLVGFADGSLDVVVFSYNGLDTLQPLATRRACLDEVRRVLRPGGLFLFSSHNARAVAKPLGPDRLARWGPWKAAGVIAWTSARLALHRLRHRPFWAGEGFEPDIVHDVAMFVTTPAKAVEQLGAAGFELVERVGGEFPRHPPAFCEQLWYYAFRSLPSSSATEAPAALR